MSRYPQGAIAMPLIGVFLDSTIFELSQDLIQRDGSDRVDFCQFGRIRSYNKLFSNNILIQMGDRCICIIEPIQSYKIHPIASVCV
jgi:hypothetical protein